MATVIDSLLIELGLDTSKFDKNQQKSVEQLRKLDEQAQRTAKNTQKGAKDMGEGFQFAKDALIAFGSILSFNAMKNFYVDTTKANVALSNTSNLLSMSNRELKSWGQMAEIVGGNLGSVTDTFKTLQANLAEVKMGGGEKFLEYMSYIQQATGKDLGFNLEKGTFDIYKLSDALADLKGKVTSGQYLQFTQAIGINPETLVLWEKGSEYLRQNKEDFDKLNASMEVNAEKAEKVNQSWTKLKAVFSSMGQGLYSATAETFNPLIDKTLKIIERDLKARQDEDKKTGTTPNSGGAVGGTNKDKTKQLMDYYQSVGWTKEQAAGIVGNLQQESSLNPNATNVSRLGIHRGIAQLEPKRQVDFKSWAGFDITDPRADLMKQAEFTNFELQKGKYIAVGNALKQIKDYQSASNLVSHKYEIAGDSSDYNRLQYAASAYGESANIIGAKNTAPVNAGGNKTEVNTNVTIGAVNTQATDANGLARDLGKELQQNTLINSGIVGNF